MKKFTKISLIVVAVMAGVGLILCGIVSMLGGGSGIWKDGELRYGNWHVGNHGIYYQGENDITIGDWEETVQKQDISLVDVRNIKLNIDAAELRVVSSDDAENIGIGLVRGNEEYYSCLLDGTTLTVKYDTDNHQIKNNSPKIELTIPKGAVFETITINTGAVEGDFSLDEISCEKMDINVGAGNFEVEKLVVTDKLEVIIGAGNLEIEDGEYQDVKLECGVGNLTFKGKVNGDIKGHCGMGEMELELEGKETDYNYNISCGLGHVEINGTTYSNVAGNKRIENAGAIGTIDLDCGMGGIDVEIE